MAQFSREELYAKQIGGYLKREIKKKGYTQEGFAALINVNPRTVRRWISEGVYKIDAIVMFTEALGVSVRDVFLEQEDIPFRFYRVYVALDIFPVMRYNQ